MRSRDGNRSLLLSISALASLLFSFTLYADEYLISYRYSVKNATLHNEQLAISKAMQKCSGEPYRSLSLQNNNEKDLLKVLTTNNEEFIEFLHRLGVEVSSREKNENMQHQSMTLLTLKTRCFKVDFNDNFVKISALK